MARMIPSSIAPEIKSNAERRIFELFRDDPGTDGWVVLHSLGIANHSTVLYGELDFFVIAPKLGVFALEVKGGRVSCENGMWYFMNKYDNTTMKSRGPFAQANEGMFSLMDAVKKKFGPQHKLGNLLFGTGVMFPDIEFTVEGTEGEQWQVFDKRENNVCEYIKRLSRNTKRKWEEHYGPFPQDKLPDSKDVKELTNMLRGNFDKIMSNATKINYAEQALITLTEEQYRCLDQLEDNPRCLIRGAAGTGKTLLAIEQVKRAVASGKKVAFFCFNNFLGSWLKQYFLNVDESLRPEYVGTIHAWMIWVSTRGANTSVRPKDSDLDHFYNEELPLITLESLENDPVSYDLVVVDEAQDLIVGDNLEILDTVIKNSLSRGKWVMFGDFTRQAIYNNGHDTERQLDLLEEKTSFIRFNLKINCRNTKQIGNEIKYITGFDSTAYLWSKVEGIPVEYKTYKTREENLEILEKLLERLIKDGVKPERITILSPYKRENSIVSDVKKQKIKDYKADLVGSITFSTIQAFKGLENTVIILTDIENFSHEKLMYVGLSRARSGLYILESEDAEKQHVQLLLKAVTK